MREQNTLYTYWTIGSIIKVYVKIHLSLEHSFIITRSFLDIHQPALYKEYFYKKRKTRPSIIEEARGDSVTVNLIFYASDTSFCMSSY